MLPVLSRTQLLQLLVHNFLQKMELYGELTQQREVVLCRPDLKNSLHLFLKRAVSATVQSVREVEAEDGQTRLDAEAACNWLRVCYELASTWRLSLDPLRRHHVCELYSFGFDRLAEEVLNMSKLWYRWFCGDAPIIGNVFAP